MALNTSAVTTPTRILGTKQMNMLFMPPETPANSANGVKTKASMGLGGVKVQTQQHAECHDNRTDCRKGAQRREAYDGFYCQKDGKTGKVSELGICIMHYESLLYWVFLLDILLFWSGIRC